MKFLPRLTLTLCLFALASAAGAADVYYYLPISELKIDAGSLSETAPASPAVVPSDTDAARRLAAAKAKADATARAAAAAMRRAYTYGEWLSAHAVGKGQTEAYLYVAPQEQMRSWVAAARTDITFAHVAIRAPEGTKPELLAIVPLNDWSGLRRIDLSVSAPPGEQAEARERFFAAKQKYYEDLMDQSLPGGAWFRHEATAAAAVLDTNVRATGANPNRFGRARATTLNDTYELFSGGRALSENLQLDRELRPPGPGEATIAVDSLSGIDTQPYDWAAAVAGLAPQKDPLATYIPADQHALFFPSFAAMLALMDQADADGTVVLHLLETRAEDAHSNKRYERQLCLEANAISRLLGPQVVASVAFTGSDPYLRTGSDIAVLFEAANPQVLQASIAARQAAAATDPIVQKVSGAVAGVKYNGVVSPGRGVSSYMAALDRVIVVTNSLPQLEGIIHASRGERPSIATLPEYTFFRGRYKRGDADETGLLVVSDATIRRWCGARWRIADSRRTRAAAALAELQCQHLDEFAKGDVQPRALDSDATLGELRLTPEGIVSAKYGTFEFLTPIIEMDVAKVSAPEENAYEWFREQYQHQWRQYFDPIAVRFTVRPEHLAADVTVRPLIQETTYREFIEVAGKPTITATAGDPHPEAMAHFVMSFNPTAKYASDLTGFARGMMPTLGANPLQWVGGWLAIFVDEDPFWQELQAKLAAAGDENDYAVDTFMEHNIHRLPLALEIPVSDGLALAAFLATVRGAVDQSGPDLTAWETRHYKEQAYVRVGEKRPAGAYEIDTDTARAKIALYYAATPTALILTLNESVLQRALDRLAARRQAEAAGQPAPATTEPWVGESLAFQARKDAFSLLRHLLNDTTNQTLQRRAWANIPILNEWHRRYPGQDPVAVHEQLWGTRLLCPGGGQYVWNDEFQTMESTVYGCPSRPRLSPNPLPQLSTISLANLGLTFEEGGVRARAVLRREVK